MSLESMGTWIRLILRGSKCGQARCARGSCWVQAQPALNLWEQEFVLFYAVAAALKRAALAAAAGSPHCGHCPLNFIDAAVAVQDAAK